jgi:hypothetical protein
VTDVARGCVYFAYSERRKLVKIGYTSLEISKRIAGLRSQWRDKSIRLVACVSTRLYKEIETILHFENEERWVFGEWFDLTVEEAIARAEHIRQRLSELPPTTTWLNLHKRMELHIKVGSTNNAAR